MKNKNQWFAAALMAISLSPVWAQDDTHTNHATGDPAAEKTNQEAMPEMSHDDMTGMEEMEGMEGMEMDHGTMVDEAPPSGLRDPHAYADDYDFSQFPMRHEGGGIKAGSLRADRLETVRGDGNTFTAYDLQAWYGGDFDRVVLKAEGDVDEGELEEARTELSWSHAIAPFWDAQLGVRQDSGTAPDCGWLALGVQGLAPYWFEIDATAYIGNEGRAALRLDAEYELLLTQKLILQPRLEADFYGKRDAERELGSGLSELTAGIRLRYEIQREFAPYLGVEWSGKYGGTAGYARAAGQETDEIRAAAGVRFWF